MPVRSALLLVLGIVVFWDAKKRGYAIEYALLWGLATAAFLPVALVYLLWGRRRKKGEEKADAVLTEGAGEQAPVDVSQKVAKPLCPDCGQPIPAGEAVCPRCGGAEEKSADAPPFLKS